MVGTQSPQNASQPTPEFDQQCRSILDGWKAGRIAFRDAIAELGLLAQQAVDEGYLANQGRAEHILGYIQGERGNLNTSIMHFERARDIYAELANQRQVTVMHLNLGESYRYKGDFNQARYLFRIAYESADREHMLDIKTVAAVNEGQMLLNMGRFEAARKALEEGHTLIQSWDNADRSPDPIQSEIHYGLALVHLQTGDPVDAWQHACMAIKTGERSQDRLKIGMAYRAVGDVLTVLPELPAEDQVNFTHDPDLYYQKAMQILRDIRAEAELGRTLYAHGRSLARRGRRLNAARQLQQAMILFTRLDMVADAANAAQAQLDVTA